MSTVEPDLSDPELVASMLGALAIERAALESALEHATFEVRRLENALNVLRAMIAETLFAQQLRR